MTPPIVPNSARARQVSPRARPTAAPRIAALCLAGLSIALAGPSTARAEAAGAWTPGELAEHARDPGQVLEAVGRIGAMDGVYGVLVARRGELVVERYYREAFRDKPHNLKSASKSVLSALAGIAASEGLLDLDRTLDHYLPQAEALDDEGKRAITVRHLLAMTTGLEATSYETYNAWIQSRDWVRAALRLPLVAAPGERFQYSTGNTHLLAAVLTGAVGRPLYDYAEEKLFAPLGIEIRGWERDPQGIYIGGNNLSLLPREMARFGQLYLDGGRFGDRQIVPADWVAESTRPTDRGLHPVYGTYALLWWSDPLHHGAFVAVGFGGQYIYVSPPHDAVVVVTSTLESKGEAWTTELFEHLRAGILAGLGPSPEYYARRGRAPVDPAIDALSAALDRARAEVATLPRLPEPADGAGFDARTAARVNLRQGPGTDRARLGVVERGRPLEILQRSGEWLEVGVGTGTGWLHGDYVEIEARGWRSVASRLTTDLAAFSSALRADLDATARGTEGETHAAVGATREGLATAEADLPTDETAAEPSAARLDEELATIRAQLTSARAEAAAAKARTLEAEGQLTASSERLGRLTTRTEAAEVASRRLTSELETARQRLADLAASRDEAEAENAALSEELAATRARLAAATEAGGDAVERNQRLADELTATRRRLAEAAEATAGAVERGERLESDLESMRGRVDAARKDSVDAAGRAERLATELTATRRRLAAAEAERDRVVELGRQLEADLEAASGRIATTETERDQAVERAAELQAELDSASGLITTTESERDAALDELQRVESAAAARDAEARRRAEEHRAALESATAAAEARTAVAARLATELEAAHRRLQELDGEADTGMAETEPPAAANFGERLAESERQAAAAQTESERLARELAQATARLERESEEHAATRARLAELKAAIGDLDRRALESAEAALPPDRPVPSEAPRAARTEIRGGAEAVRQMVESWATAWSAQDVERYLGYYSDLFEPADGLDLERWKRRRRFLVVRPAFIEVRIEDLEIAVLRPDRVRVRFLQRYRSNERNLVGRKTLELALEEGRWRILGEETP